MPKSHKPKILVISTTDCKGGAARVGWNIGQNLISKGYSVKYLVGYKYSDKKYVAELKKPWITRVIDQNLHLPVTKIYRHLLSFVTGNDLDRGASDEIMEHPWYQEADIIHFHNLHGSYFKLDTLKLMLVKKIIWTLHDMWSITGNSAYAEQKESWTKGKSFRRSFMDYPPMLINRSYELWNRKSVIYQNLKNLIIVTPSKWLEQIVGESNLSKFPRKVIYNGIDENIFKPGNKLQLRKQLGLPLDKRIVCFVAQGGNSDPRKGWKYVKELARSYINDNSVIFLCIGGHESKTEGNITFVKTVSNSQILSSYYSASDIFLLTSLAENCPLVVLEAMSCGLPIVSFDVGGVKELVIDGVNGKIAKYGDGTSLANSLIWTLGLDSQARKQIGEKNRLRVINNFTISHMADNYLKLYTHEI